MQREDYNLAFLLRYENVAWYENGKVRILDRRVYPYKIEFVECTNYMQVSEAIRDMVTQSAGPYTAVGMGMALAAYEARHLKREDKLAFLNEAADKLAHSRPTTANRYGQITMKCVEKAEEALSLGFDPVQCIFEQTIESLNRRYHTMEKAARYLVEQIPENGVVLTQCFGETIIGMMCRIANEQHKSIRFYHAETRPYLQGARLTASVCHEMGFDSTVISDNMTAYVLEKKDVDLFTSAADTIAMDGHIANKIGTFQIAILCTYFGIPYFVTGIPDIDKSSVKDIMIEERDAEMVLSMNGLKHTMEGVKGLYPSFDITPPHLISGIITDKGIFSPYDLHSYTKTAVEAFY